MGVALKVLHNTKAVLTAGVKAQSHILISRILLLVLLFLTIPLGRAHVGAPLTAFASAVPTIDGVLKPNEWASAATEQFTMAQSYKGTLYVMNDQENLYIAVQISDSTNDNYKDYISIFFDNKNAGVHSEGDDGIQLQLATFLDLFWSKTKWPNYYQNYNNDKSDQGSKDGSGAAAYAEGIWTFELKKLLRSADVTHDFQLSPGQTVGFALEYNDNDNYVGSFPGLSDEPSKWGDILIAAAPPNVTATSTQNQQPTSTSTLTQQSQSTQQILSFPQVGSLLEIIQQNSLMIIGMLVVVLIILAILVVRRPAREYPTPRIPPRGRRPPAYSAPTPRTSPIFCMSCGGPLRVGVKFCGKCGEPISS